MGKKNLKRDTKCTIFNRGEAKLLTCCSLLVEAHLLLVTHCKIRLLLVAEVARCTESLVTSCKIRSLHVEEVTRCEKSLVTHCKVRLLLVAEVELFFVILIKSDSSTGVFLKISVKY